MTVKAVAIIVLVTALLLASLAVYGVLDAQDASAMAGIETAPLNPPAGRPAAAHTEPSGRPGVREYCVCTRGEPMVTSVEPARIRRIDVIL